MSQDTNIPMSASAGSPTEKNDTPDLSNGSDAAISHTHNELERALSSKGSKETSSPELSVLHLPSFIIRKENGVFVNLEALANREIFLTFINYIFESGYYFKEMNYTGIMGILYDFEKAMELCKKFREAKRASEIKIAYNIEVFDEKRISFYRKPNISGDGKSAEYLFDPVYTEESSEGGPTKRVTEKIDIDEFIAAMWWKYGIRFGLDIDRIKKAIDTMGGKEISRLVISREKDALPGKDATVKSLISFDKDPGLLEGTDGIADLHTYKQSFTQVMQDTLLYQKISRQDGEPGWDIHGNRIDPAIPKDLNLSSLLGIGVRVETKNNIEYIVSNYTGYPKKILDKMDMLSKIDIQDTITFDDSIGPITGNIRADKDVNINGNIDTGYFQKGENIHVIGDVSGEIHAKENITIGGNIFGSVKGNLISEKHRKVSMILNGKILSDGGDIEIKGHANNAHIEARKGTIQISNIINSVIIAKRVEISKSVFNCTIIADEIVIKGTVIGCRMISGKNIDMAESTEKGNFENIIDIFSRDLSGSIEKKQEFLEKERKMIAEKEDEIDTSITSNFPNITKIIPEKEKRLRTIIVLMGILENPKSVEEEKNKSYAELFRRMRSALEGNRANWGKLQNHCSSVVQLSGEITTETTLMEQSRQELHIKIGNIRGFTHVQRIRFPENKELLDFDVKEVLSMSKHLVVGSASKQSTGGDDPVSYVIERIPAPDIGGFEWKSGNE